MEDIVTEAELNETKTVEVPAPKTVKPVVEVEEEVAVVEKPRKVSKASVAVKEIDVGELLLKQREMEERLSSITKEYEKVKAEKESIVAEKVERSVSEKLLSIAKACDMVDPEDILPYFRSKVKLARDGSVVLADKADKALEDEIKEFLAKKPHLVKANVAQSTGARPTPQGSLLPKPSVDLSSNTGMTEYARSLLRR